MDHVGILLSQFGPVGPVGEGIPVSHNAVSAHAVCGDRATFEHERPKGDHFAGPGVGFEIRRQAYMILNTIRVPSLRATDCQL